jgi:hypothetical protein
VEPGQITTTREDGTSLVLHHGTDRFATVYRVNEFEPFNRGVRADQGGDAPWSDGGWSGAEWRAVASIPIKLGIHTTSWQDLMAAWWVLDAALAPVRTGGDVEITWNAAGTEYLMYARPRGATLKNERGRTGIGRVTAHLECPDPAIYSAVEYSAEIGLLHRIGGLSVPFGLPATIPSVVADGEVTLTNAGNSPARLLLHIDGPCPASRVSVITGTSVQTLYIDTVLGSGDYLDIDTKDKIVLLNSTVTRLPDVWNDWPLLPPGESLVRFESDTYDAGARLTVRHRDTY